MMCAEVVASGRQPALNLGDMKIPEDLFLIVGEDEVLLGRGGRPAVQGAELPAGAPRRIRNWGLELAVSRLLAAQLAPGTALDRALDGKVNSALQQCFARYGLARLATAPPSAAARAADDETEEMEVRIRASLSKLPHVRQVSYRTEGNKWFLVVIHNYGAYSEAILEVNKRLREIERKAPGTYLEARFIGTSEASPGDASGNRVIF